ncbi:ornithine carbamoyltransferase [Desulfomarina profundi]|uniref:Ornithine carbamoyltransferase n=1 Tax=Desulfomarina profundi TaxID=2772557 RepID=A0A8D5FRZ3_9BACT|nr:ABC transporter permease [Desulfomarina profundi]BCL60326.1 ornithine carbamoyltransferase [Desulfomarina profundi]
MIRTLPCSRLYKVGYSLYILLFYIFLIMPLVTICVLAFNDSNFIALPWNGFSLDWFFADTDDRLGLFKDPDLMMSVWTSVETGFFVAMFSTIVGTIAALLFEEERFRFKGLLYFLALAPLVIPGVVLGISILLTSTYTGTYMEETFGWDMEFLSPGFWLVVIGQFSFGATYVMLLVGARLKKFDKVLEEAALSLRATRLEVIRLITLPFLRPAIIGAFVVTFLISFSNFNTTIFLIGSDPTLPVDLYSRIKFSSTPVLNAVSFMIVMFITFSAMISFVLNRKKI